MSNDNLTMPIQLTPINFIINKQSNKLPFPKTNQLPFKKPY